eukprot:CAMPEP_0202866064 /NCGR_PEP_ID=MMETSP1391-20130828/7180_1 /ASSEMBLY_ACC=CAM_ASM_000867 /TAXON_ID=1034604 /ORGANISM="Chlamydomonas leiostraca, Strain SAG 11-49" /LENGTH=348 /DNA_ID=CAMNT_0049545977 /DNA_START=31 /DNA_END=1077 /DNA_ORIENTATION=-
MGLARSPVPGAVVLALCLLAFLAGRFVKQTSQLPEAKPVVKLGTAGEQRRTLSSDSDAQLPTKSKGAVQAWPAPTDPLDPVQLENYMLGASGLLKVRPPLQPAPSGEDFVRAIPFQVLSWFPRIVVYPGFVDRARCEHVVKISKAIMYPSGLAYRPGENSDPNQQTRTSTGTFLSTSQDPDGVLAWIEERIAAITLIPRENGEPFNVLHYENMQHYDSHMDSFDPKEFGPQPSQRIATVLVYLSDVEEGGETVFKREGADAATKDIIDWRNCNDGSFKYKPRLGDAVLFWSTTPDGEIDPHALHGGCPVVKGEKWVVTKWLRSKGGHPYWITDEMEEKARLIRGGAGR